MIEQAGVLRWDIDNIAGSLHLTPQETKEYFTDGRRVSFILERRICREIVGGVLSPSEGAGFDLIDELGRKWEVRLHHKRRNLLLSKLYDRIGSKVRRKWFLREIE